MNAEMKTECKLEVKEKQTLKSLLTEVQIEELQSGNMVATCGGQKLRLNDEIKSPICIFSISLPSIFVPAAKHQHTSIPS